MLTKGIRKNLEIVPWLKFFILQKGPVWVDFTFARLESGGLVLGGRGGRYEFLKERG